MKRTRENQQPRAEQSDTAIDTLSIGNNAQTTDRNTFQTDTAGNILRALNNTLVSGVVYDGEYLWFGTLYSECCRVI